MKDLFIKLKYHLNQNDFEVESNVKEHRLTDIVANFLRGQIGKGEDYKEADKRDVYSIDLYLDLSFDIFSCSHDCGNLSLRDGILMNFLSQSKEPEL